jgi:anti-anti-sigma factor
MHDHIEVNEPSTADHPVGAHRRALYDERVTSGATLVRAVQQPANSSLRHFLRASAANRGSEPMTTRTHRCSRATSRPLCGELDIATVPAVRAELEEHARRLRGPALVLDCRDLEFIDSSGLQMLVEVAAGASKSIRLVNVAPSTRRIFEITGLAPQFGLG